MLQRRGVFISAERLFLSLEKSAGIGQPDPWQLLGASTGNRRHSKAVVRKTAGRNADQVRSNGRVPEHSRSAPVTKMALLVVVSCRVMKRVNTHFTADVGYI